MRGNLFAPHLFSHGRKLSHKQFRLIRSKWGCHDKQHRMKLDQDTGLPPGRPYSARCTSWCPVAPWEGFSIKCADCKSAQITGTGTGIINLTEMEATDEQLAHGTKKTPSLAQFIKSFSAAVNARTPWKNNILLPPLSGADAMLLWILLAAAVADCTIKL